MRRLSIIAAVLMVPQVAFAWPWSTDMMNQPAIKPQAPDPLLKEFPQMAPFPTRSIPVEGIPTQVANRDEAKELKNPYEVTPKSLKKGRDMFRIYCAACHGLSGKADVAISGKMGAIDLTSDYVQKELTEGWIFGTITFGSFIMPAYGVPAGNAENRGSNDLSVEERWHVVNYVKNALMKEPAVQTAAAAK